MPVGDWTEVRDTLARIAGLSAGTPETVTLRRAAGRILAEPVHARRPLPNRTHAVMDGFAVGAAGAGRYRIVEGAAPALEPDEARPIAAGDAPPMGTAAVVLSHRAMIGDGGLTIDRDLAENNIRRIGEEAGEGDRIIEACERLDARHLALAAAAGIDKVAVQARLSVALLSLHEGEEPLPHHRIMAAMLDSPALRVADLGAIRQALLAERIARLASRHPFTLVVAESLGDEDGALAAAIAQAGGRARIHRPNLKPAKPIITGDLAGAAVLGFAGTAYAVAAAAHLFLRPMLRGALEVQPDQAFRMAIADFERQRRPGRAELLPVVARHEGTSLLLRSAGRFGQLSALAAMDGFALVEAEAGDIAPGSPLFYHPLMMPLI